MFQRKYILGGVAALVIAGSAIVAVGQVLNNETAKALKSQLAAGV